MAFVPKDGDFSVPTTLVSEDGKHVFQTFNNKTEPLGPTSGYLKIVRVSCAGCSILTAALCDSEGTFVNPK